MNNMETISIKSAMIFCLIFMTIISVIEYKQGIKAGRLELINSSIEFARTCRKDSTDYYGWNNITDKTYEVVKINCKDFNYSVGKI